MLIPQMPTGSTQCSRVGPLPQGGHKVKDGSLWKKGDIFCLKGILESDFPAG